MAKEVKKHRRLKFNKLGKFLTVFVVIVVALLITITAAQKLGNMTLNAIASDVSEYFLSFSAGDGYPYSIDSDTVKDIKLNNSNLFLLLSDKTMVLNSTAKEIMPNEHTYSNPVMKINGSKIIVYDLNSGKYRIQSGSDVVEEFEDKNQILCANISKNGNYAIATYSDECQSVLKAFSKSRKEQFTYNFKSERVISISLSDNGKYFAVGAVSAKNGSMLSKLYVFNISTGDTVKTFDYSSSTIIQVDYVKGNNISVLCDNMRQYISDGSTIAGSETFDSDTLHNYCVAGDGSQALVLSKYGSNTLSSLTFYSKSNKKKYTVDFDKEAKWVSTDGNYTAVLFDKSIKTFNKNGKQVGEIYFDGEPVRVQVDSTRTYVLTSVGLQCYKTKGITDERMTEND